MDKDRRQHENSIEAYNAIRSRLSEYRGCVYDAIRAHSNVDIDPTDHDLLAFCVTTFPPCRHWEINSITGKVRELIDMGCALETGKRIHAETGMPRRTVRVTTPEEYDAHRALVRPVSRGEQLTIIRNTLLEVRQLAVEAGLFGGEIVDRIDAGLNRAGLD